MVFLEIITKERKVKIMSVKTKCERCEADMIEGVVYCVECFYELPKTECPECEGQTIEEVYQPSASMEMFCPDCELYFNRFGQELRNPDDYDCYGDGYTPFGDE
jgi:hypothetical protein